MGTSAVATHLRAACVFGCWEPSLAPVTHVYVALARQQAAGKVSVGAVALVACVGLSSSVRHRGLLQQVSRLLTVLYCSPPWRYRLMHIYTLCYAHQVFVFCPTYQT
jgi:hypothetical protein